MKVGVAMELCLMYLLLAAGTWAAHALGPASYPPLSVLEGALLTTAQKDFGGHEPGYHTAAGWDKDRLRSGPKGVRAPHLVCADYGRGREAFALLRENLSQEAVIHVSHSREYGACFIATASHEQATTLSSDLERFRLSSIGPFPSALKLAPGLLDRHGESGPVERLATVHGLSMRLDNVGGIEIQLTPGTLPQNSLSGQSFLHSFVEDLMSKSLDLHSMSVWSDPAVVGGEHLATDEGAFCAREWTRAAQVVHDLSSAVGTGPGDICSWQSISIHQAGDDVLLLSGMDHLLLSGRGAGGQGKESAELRMACFMGLLSFVASRSEVFRVSPRLKKSLSNAAARANIQSASVTSSPLTDAGLTGEGEVVQIVDAGLNETSCFFEDGDGAEVEHGYYFEEVGSNNPYFTYSSDSFSRFKEIFTGGDFTYDSSRRKVIQYINLIKSDLESQEYGEAISTDEGGRFPFVPADSFEQDDTLGHGTHVACTVAGATLQSNPTIVTCSNGEAGCAGGCVSGGGSSSTDDGDDTDLDKLCPAFDCAGAEEARCLGDDVGETLAAHGGMAQGAKLAIFDIFFGDYSFGDLAGNGLWEACKDAGCRIHSNSYGVDSRCKLGPVDLLYDAFMYENPEHLLLFAAGNDGWFTDRDGLCTVNAPALAKNVLAIGATSSGSTRLTITDADGKEAGGTLGDATIDTIAAFSSYGPTQIYSARGGVGDYSCRLIARDGTSMSTAVASGAAALVRQYFRDSSFYAKDVTARGFCDGGFICDSFSPSAATVKAMLVNSANLLGGSSEPGDFRGFGRIHLEAGMPLSGEGSMALYVADAADTSIEEKTVTNFYFDVDADAGLDLRATVAWIDPPATSSSAEQLVNNLDLRVISPSGKKFYMWSENKWDTVNVIERVIVDVEDVNESGTWLVRVRSRSFSTDDQSYSLVVTGAISPPNDGASSPHQASDGASLQSDVSYTLYYDDVEEYYAQGQTDDDYESIVEEQVTDDDGEIGDDDEELGDDDEELGDDDEEFGDDGTGAVQSEDGAGSTASPAFLLTALLAVASVYTMACVA